MCRIHHRVNLKIRSRCGHEVENAAFLSFFGITDIELEHEAVELRFRQLIGSFLFKRILRGQNQKRIGERIGLIADRYLPLLHGFQQGALNFRRRAIDFVGEDQVRKNGAELCGELAATRIINQRAD